MNKGLKTLAMTLTGAMLIVSLGRCDGGETSTDTGGVSPKDGSVATQDTGTVEAGDTGTTQAGDTGTAQTPDTGSTAKPDSGPSGVETTIPVINNTTDPGHAAFATYPNNKVHFKGIAVSPMFRDSMTTSGDPKYWNCSMGIYLADPNATSAEHNGVLLLSEGSVTTVATDGGVKASGCKGDSPLEQASGATIAVGDELEVTGYFVEDCFRTGSNGPCAVTDQNGKGLSRVTIEAHSPGSIVRSGQRFAVPATLPAKVTIDEVGGSGYAAADAGVVSVTVGAKWWQSRQVLVSVENVKVTDDTGKSCTWTVEQTGGKTLVVQDDVMFAGTSCPGRPPKDTAITSLTGLMSWFTTGTKSLGTVTAETQIAPRGVSDYGWQLTNPDAGMPPDAN